MKTSIKTGEKSSLLVHFHQFLAEVDLGEGNSQNLGTEIDLVFNAILDKVVNLKIGYSHMFANEAMEVLKNGSSSELNNWAWAMLTIKPTLFISN